MKTHDFVNVLLERVEKKGSPYISIGAMDYDTADLVCAVNNCGLAVWKPESRELYVRVENCERYLAAREVA